MAEFRTKIPALFGLGLPIERMFGQVFGAGAKGEVLAAPATLATPNNMTGLSDYDVEYLRSLATTRGQAALLVAPDLVPEAWQGR